MKNTMYRSISLLLALVLVLALVLLPGNDPANTVSASDLPVGEGVTLHCWNWSYKSIEENLPLIAGMGYTSIQTSPIQQAKQATAGYQYYDWWVYYQPASFSIDNTGNSALGTKAEFESMCRKAHSYGIKVIVDIVANHMGNQSGNDLAPSIIPDLRNDPSCWHDISRNTNDYSKRYDVTQWCMAGLPDLNTANKKVQNYVLSFMKECIDAGVDGFRFDAAKHIETPDDGGDNCASDFWPTIINGATSYASSTRGIDLYCYGEVLDSLGGSLSMTSYTKYMSVTDNTWSDSVRNQVINGRNAGAFSYLYHKGNDASKLVLWAESHDTYANNASSGTSTGSINKTWALVAARGDAMSLYFARPGSYAQALGTASVTGWANAEVGAVNRFHNHFNGQSEYVANENGIAYVERGTSGVVLVNCSGNSTVINVTAHTIKDGIYIDQISGNKFTVSGGRIEGSIGDTGIAVVYNTESCRHAAHSIDGYCTNCYAPVDHSYGADGTCSCGASKTRTIYFCNSSGWSKVNYYSWYTGGGEVAGSWPGKAMTWVEGDIYSCTVPSDVQNIIFNNGSAQTADLTIPSLSGGKNLYHYATGQWSSYIVDPTEETEPVETTPVATEPPETEPEQTDPVVTDPADPETTQPGATEETNPTETKPDSTDPETTEPSKGKDPTVTDPTQPPAAEDEKQGSPLWLLTLLIPAAIVVVVVARRRK